MTSMGGDHQSYDYTHMYNIKDLRGNLPHKEIPQDTIMSSVKQHPLGNKFSFLINNTIVAPLYNNHNTSFTIFVPIDTGISDDVLKLDSYNLAQLITYHTIEVSLPVEFLKSSNSMFLKTRTSGSNILVETNSQGDIILNRHSKVLGYLRNTNSVVYFIDKMLIPGVNPNIF